MNDPINNSNDGNELPPYENIDFRQMLDGAAEDSAASGSIGVLDDHAETFTSGRQLSPSSRQHNPSSQLFTKNGGYSETRQEITVLLYMQEDEDFMRPTAYAFDLTLDLLENTNSELLGLEEFFPRGTSSASDNGGIYLFWEKQGMSIQVEIPPKNGGMYYIHTIISNQSLMNREVSAKALANALADYNLLGSQRLGTVNAPASSIA